jgi:hypothetical protein
MMKRFGTGNAPFIANNGNIPEGNSGELTRPTNQFFNNVYGENKRFVEASGQALQTLVADDNQQTAKAAFIHSTVAPSVIVSGGNTKVLAVRGSLVLPANVLLDGALFSFECNSTTTSAVFITLNGVPYPLLWQGAALDATTVLHASLSYQIKYDQPNARFILVTPPQSYFDGLIQTALNAQFDRQYPVPTISNPEQAGTYISTDPRNPSIYLGRGTWVAWGGGTHLSFAGTSDGVTLVGGTVSGSHTHTLTNAQMSEHQHGQRVSSDGTVNNKQSDVSNTTTPTSNTSGGQTDGTLYQTFSQLYTDAEGEGEAMPIRPRTTTVYGWRRTA